MLVRAVAFSQWVVAIHVVAVVVAFGVTFAYPVFWLVGRKVDPRGLPWFHRMQQQVSRRITNPGLLVVLVAGIYLASDLHKWKHFFVQWGIGAVVVLGGLEGSFMIKQTGKLAELAERDIAASATGEVRLSAEYDALARRVGTVGGLESLLVVATIFLMVLNA